jgi:uncharacterized integral membrane protein
MRLLKLLAIAPFAILFLMFAFANRHYVTVSFDPFASGDIPAFSLDGPLFLILIIVVMLGVLVGGAATWLGQGKHRRAARQARAEAAKLRADLDAMRAGQGNSRLGAPLPLSRSA